MLARDWFYSERGRIGLDALVVIERMLTDVGFTLESADYHAPLHGTYRCRKPGAGEPRSQPCRSLAGRR